MKKTALLILLIIMTSTYGNAQLAVSKMLGKDGKHYKMGLGLFANYDFALTEEGNRSIMLELMDFDYFRTNDKDAYNDRTYISIKLGYRYIFGESRTGFYLEPQAGYVRTVDSGEEGEEASHKDGIALAMEAGYSLEVGERGNAILFGVKYENDNPGHELNIQSIAFRLGYSFGWLRRNR